MSRILEFQPTDEQTVVARVLVELHQAIDTHFPGANPSARQFSKTVLTNQGGESTRVDNAPGGNSISDRQEMCAQPPTTPGIEKSQLSELSMTPKTGQAAKQADAPLATEELRRLMGESSLSKRVGKILIAGLIAGLAVFVFIYFGGVESFFRRGN